jgi:hypothetical protein
MPDHAPVIQHRWLSTPLKIVIAVIAILAIVAVIIATASTSTLLKAQNIAENGAPCPEFNNTPCGGRGTCTNGVCACKRGFAGDACQKEVPLACPGPPDGKGGVLECGGTLRGTCDSTTGTCTCNSKEGFFGDDCMTQGMACPEDCGTHGTCDSTTGMCVCDSGYFGDACQIALACPGNCSGHGTCESDGSCTCDSGYYGPNCSVTISNKCPSNCGGHGVCDSSRNACICDAGFSGPDCSTTCPSTDGRSCATEVHCRGYGEEGFSECNKDVAVGATCSSGVCSCPPGFYGKDCASKVSNNCSEGCGLHGTCDTATATCVCDDGYYGHDCSKTEPTPYDTLLQVVQGTTYVAPSITAFYKAVTGTDETGATVSYRRANETALSMLIGNTIAPQGVCQYDPGAGSSSCVCTGDPGYTGSTCASCASGFGPTDPDADPTKPYFGLCAPECPSTGADAITGETYFTDGPACNGNGVCDRSSGTAATCACFKFDGEGNQLPQSTPDNSDEVQFTFIGSACQTPVTRLKDRGTLATKRVQSPRPSGDLSAWNGPKACAGYVARAISEATLAAVQAAAKTTTKYADFIDPSNPKSCVTLLTKAGGKHVSHPSVSASLRRVAAADPSDPSLGNAAHKAVLAHMQSGQNAGLVPSASHAAEARSMFRSSKTVTGFTADAKDAEAVATTTMIIGMCRYEWYKAQGKPCEDGGTPGTTCVSTSTASTDALGQFCYGGGACTRFDGLCTSGADGNGSVGCFAGRAGVPVNGQITPGADGSYISAMASTLFNHWTATGATTGTGSAPTAMDIAACRYCAQGHLPTNGTSGYGTASAFDDGTCVPCLHGDCCTSCSTNGTGSTTADACKTITAADISAAAASGTSALQALSSQWCHYNVGPYNGSTDTVASLHRSSVRRPGDTAADGTPGACIAVQQSNATLDPSVKEASVQCFCSFEALVPGNTESNPDCNPAKGSCCLQQNLHPGLTSDEGYSAYAGKVDNPCRDHSNLLTAASASARLAQSQSAAAAGSAPPTLKPVSLDTDNGRVGCAACGGAGLADGKGKDGCGWMLPGDKYRRSCEALASESYEFLIENAKLSCPDSAAAIWEQQFLNGTDAPVGSSCASGATHVDILSEPSGTPGSLVENGYRVVISPTTYPPSGCCKDATNACDQYFHSTHGSCGAMYDGCTGKVCPGSYGTAWWRSSACATLLDDALTFVGDTSSGTKIIRNSDPAWAYFNANGAYNGKTSITVSLDKSWLIPGSKQRAYAYYVTLWDMPYYDALLNPTSGQFSGSTDSDYYKWRGFFEKHKELCHLGTAAGCTGSQAEMFQYRCGAGDGGMKMGHDTQGRAPGVCQAIIYCGGLHTECAWLDHGSTCGTSSHTGSCFRGFARVSMADGSTKRVSEVVPGDVVKGPSGEPTLVLWTTRHAGGERVWAPDGEVPFAAWSHPVMTTDGRVASVDVQATSGTLQDDRDDYVRMLDTGDLRHCGVHVVADRAVARIVHDYVPPEESLYDLVTSTGGVTIEGIAFRDNAPNIARCPRAALMYIDILRFLFDHIPVEFAQELFRGADCRGLRGGCSSGAESVPEPESAWWTPEERDVRVLARSIGARDTLGQKCDVFLMFALGEDAIANEPDDDDCAEEAAEHLELFYSEVVPEHPWAPLLADAVWAACGGRLQAYAARLNIHSAREKLQRLLREEGMEAMFGGWQEGLEAVVSSEAAEVAELGPSPTRVERGTWMHAHSPRVGIMSFPGFAPWKMSWPVNATAWRLRLTTSEVSLRASGSQEVATWESSNGYLLALRTEGSEDPRVFVRNRDRPEHVWDRTLPHLWRNAL